MALRRLLLPILLTCTWANAQSAQNRSWPADQRDGMYYVAEGGIFNNSVSYTFASPSNSSSKRAESLPDGLVSQPERIAKESGALYDHEFTNDNLKVENGYMTLTVPGGQSKSPLTGAQVVTTEENILYASVRMVAILGDPAGACNAIFFYHNDSQEADIEFLSSSKSQSNPGNGSRPLHYTNQANDGNMDHATEQDGQLPDDATSREHEYRIDWLPGSTKFFVDGVLQQTLTDNVPSVLGSWIWNNWANGDPGWTADPPQEDNVMKIRSIQMYYNTSTGTGSNSDATGDGGRSLSPIPWTLALVMGIALSCVSL